MSAREFPASAKLSCIEREFGYRKRVYKRLVERGKMGPEKAHIETELMEAIAADYRALVEKERLI